MKKILYIFFQFKYNKLSFSVLNKRLSLCFCKYRFKHKLTFLHKYKNIKKHIKTYSIFIFQFSNPKFKNNIDLINDTYAKFIIFFQVNFRKLFTLVLKNQFIFYRSLFNIRNLITGKNFSKIFQFYKKNTIYL